ncbi:hypothetical protein psyc5s11_46960 [Clostridium gelidum]|uniref:Flagellar hook-associated protein 2 n=1 Tax=Clostridium gelidum TaxID=704125 RepID=A0ABM7TK65_9CLOT|nr:flagellar filament capping protein FliD [Clostridium gelidum]BCZ48629.1 hypothetical protein psyc5s11_46960 [Clostridium gelidum]
MPTRITGMNSGLDVDTLVKTAMKPYQAKVDKEVQNRKVLEYQQEQYKQIMSDSSDFYDKYFDILKTGNLMSDNTYQTQTYTSTPDGSKVTAKGLAGASIDNYTVNVTQLAAKASDSLLSSETGNKSITIGTATVSFAATSDGNITVANYNSAIAKMKSDLSAKVKAGTASDGEKTQLSDLTNKAVTAKYSEFSKNVTFTANTFGGGGFQIKDAASPPVTSKDHAKVEDKYLEATVKNSKGQVYTITSADKQISNNVTVDNVQFDFKGVSTSTSVAAGAITPLVALTEATALTPLTELTPLADAVGTPTTDGTTTANGITTKKTTAADGTVTTETTDGSGTKTTTVTAKDKSTVVTTTKGAVTTVTDANGMKTTTDTSNLDSVNNTGYTLTTVKIGTTTTTTKLNADGTIPVTKRIETSAIPPITTTLTTTALNSGDGRTTTAIQKDITVGGTTPTTTTTTSSVTKQDKTNGSVTTVVGEDGISTTTDFTVDPTSGSTTKTISTSSGTHLATTDPGTTTTTVGGITTVTKIGTDGSITQTVITPSGTNLTPGDAGTTTTTDVDGTTQITTKIGTDGSITKTLTPQAGAPTTTVTTTTVKIATAYNAPTSLTGATDVKDLKDKIVSFVNDYNKLLQSMNTKIYETRDKDYMPLTDEQKKAMSETQITAWEKKAQTGLLRKDDDLQRITSEMKNAMSSVMSGSGLSLEKIGIAPIKNYTDKNGMLSIDESKLTTALEANSGDVQDLFKRAASTTDQGGAITQLKSALKSEFKTSTSSLSKKAGYSGSSTETDNTITNSIAKKKTLIAQLNSSLTTKENALYKKYSALEKAMEQLNSQKSSLASMLGQ